MWVTYLVSLGHKVALLIINYTKDKIDLIVKRKKKA